MQDQIISEEVEKLYDSEELRAKSVEEWAGMGVIVLIVQILTKIYVNIIIHI